MQRTITVNPAKTEKRQETGKELIFGATFSDHMFVQTFNSEAGWHDAKIQKLVNFSLHPAAAVLHYGQEIFEGLKAYLRPDGKINLFRPEENFKRFNRSAARMVMPQVEEDFHLDALRQLIQQDRQWVPSDPGSSLYIRPAMIASSPKLGLGASEEYLHFIITGPVGPYFPEGFNPVAVYVSDHSRRAVIGGIGEAKTGGNYAASLAMSEEVAKKGYTQVLWLDAIHGKYVEEVGAMNICFVYENSRIVTPKLSGSILPGVTRDSVLKLAPTLGYEASEALLDIEEILRDLEANKITEVFGCGTAAVISPVGRLHFRGKDVSVNGNETGPVAKALQAALTGIQYGTREDTFGWTQTVEP